MNWEIFFNNNILGNSPNEGYLIWDLEEMNKIEVKGAGNCGYPMLMSILSGMELLGGLIDDYTWNSYKGEKYFRRFYDNYFEKYNESYEGRAAEFYNLLRHKLAHTFLTAVKFQIAKNQFPEPITKHGESEVIDVGLVFKDFKKAVIAIKKDLKSSRDLSGLFNARLPEMIKEYGGLPPGASFPEDDVYTTETTISGTLTRSSYKSPTSNATTAIPPDVMRNMKMIRTDKKDSNKGKPE